MRSAVMTIDKKVLPAMLILLVLLAIGASISSALPDSSTKVQGQACEMGHYFYYDYDFSYDTAMNIGKSYPLTIAFSIGRSVVTDNPYQVDVSVSADGFELSEKQFSLASGPKTITITPTKAGAKLSITGRLLLDGDTPRHTGYQAIYFDTFTLDDFSIASAGTAESPSGSQNSSQAGKSRIKVSDDKTINQTTTTEGNKTTTNVAVERNAPSEIPWYIVRITGMVAYVLLAVSVIMGILRKLNPKKFGKPCRLHCDISYLAIIFAFMHAVDNLIDRYMWNLKLNDIFWLSFRNQTHTQLSVGVIAFYLMLMVTITSLSPKIMAFIKRKNWYAIHLTSYVAFVFVVVHSLLLGTDLSIAKLNNPISIISFSVFAIFLIITVVLFFALVFRKKPANAEEDSCEAKQ